MAECLYTINASVGQVRSIVTELFTQEGWTVVPFSADIPQVTRDEKGMSITFGTLMGSNFYLSQNLQSGTDPYGEALVCYLSSTGLVTTGSVLGIRETVKMHAEYAEKLAGTLQARDIFMSVRQPPPSTRLPSPLSPTASPVLR